MQTNLIFLLLLGKTALVQVNLPIAIDLCITRLSSVTYICVPCLNV